MGKLVLYRPSEQPFDVDCVANAVSNLPKAQRRAGNIPGALLWFDVHLEPPVVVRLNDTADAIWVDDESDVAFELVAAMVSWFQEKIVVADLQGNWAVIKPGSSGEHIQCALSEA